MRRVVVTGIGMVTPLGIGATPTWEALIAGRSGVGPITVVDASQIPIKAAGEVKGFDPAEHLDVRSARRLARFEQFANLAVAEALEQSGLPINEDNAHRIGYTVSSAFGGINEIHEQVSGYNEGGPGRVSPFGLSMFMTTSSSVNIRHGIRGLSLSAASACATGADGIGLGLLLIRAGMADAVIAGGVDAPLAPITLAAFERIRAYSRRSERTPAPFSADRDGLVIGEGAGVLVLESLEHARARGAVILAEVAGYGATSDAYHMTAPREDGSGGALAMRIALDDAGIAPSELDYINAHGTGTLLNDSAETLAIKTAFGEHAYQIPISSTKSMTAHMMGASGAVEAIFCIQAIRHGMVPPTIHYTEPDPACDLDYVPNTARQVAVRVALSNSFGFGGHNSVLVMRAF